MFKVHGGEKMRICIIYRGPFGEQMVNNIALRGFGENIVSVYELKPEKIEEEHPDENVWENIWEEPGKYIPNDLPSVECDLLLVLGIHSRLGDLIPPIAEKLKAKAVIYSIDDKDMAPESRRTIQDELEARGIYVEFPEPFCTLKGSKNELINEFAKKFGRAKFEIKLDERKKIIRDVKVIRDTPCGTASRIAEILKGTSYENKEELIKRIYEEHHNESADNYCMAEMDPLYPLMQEAGDLLKDAIFEACGFETIKEVILRKVKEHGEVDIKDLEEITVGKAGDWSNSNKVCDANRTLNLYIDELIREGRIVKTKEGKLKPL
jgi:hypothetical protein